MPSPFTFPSVPYEKCRVLSCQPKFTFERDWVPHLPLFEIVHRCRTVWGVGTGKENILRLEEKFLRHLIRGHIQTTVPCRSAKRVKDLTDRIMRMHAYPAAYGGFSDIWSCQLQHQWSPPERVAVKAIRPTITNDEEFLLKQKAFERELKVWIGLEHRNVLPLYGVTDGFGQLPAFVSPWADNGTLSEYLEKFETRLDMKKRLILLNDIADGLHYLHSRNIRHGDLSGSNIMITENGRACLSDFGLSTLFEQVSDTMSSGVCFPGNIRWAAPELFECEKDGPPSQLSSQQADVYSFGSIMLQILSGKLPFHSVQRVAQIVIMISCGCKPRREPRWDGGVIPDVLWKFVEACWASPHERPSRKEIVGFIKSQLSML